MGIEHKSDADVDPEARGYRELQQPKQEPVPQHKIDITPARPIPVEQLADQEPEDVIVSEKKSLLNAKGLLGETIETHQNGISINGVKYPNVVIDYGGGTLTGALQMARDPRTGVVVVDPSLDEIGHELVDRIVTGHFADVTSVLRQFPIYEEIPPEIRAELEAYYRHCAAGIVENGWPTNIALLASTMENAPVANAEQVVCQFPCPKLMTPQRVYENARVKLKQNGLAVVTSDNSQWVNAQMHYLADRATSGFQLTRVQDLRSRRPTSHMPISTYDLLLEKNPASICVQMDAIKI